jgi:hypothetical protein
VADLNERLAKSLMTGLKTGLRQSRVPITQLQVHIVAITDRGDVVGIDMNGVPPFTTSMVTVNGNTRTYLGHTEVDPNPETYPEGLYPEGTDGP